MKYPYMVYNQKCYSNGFLFPTYFETQKKAFAYAATIENPIVKRRIGGEWVRIN